MNYNYVIAAVLLLSVVLVSGCTEQQGDTVATSSGVTEQNTIDAGNELQNVDAGADIIDENFDLEEII